MSTQQGVIELERAVDSIQVGHRHRADFGDIATLAASIDRDGLLQPITITPDGVLVCGARRLAAIKQLGWSSVRVWVRSGISSRLGYLLAEQDDNVLHKPLTQLEAAALYRELKALLAEDAAQREAATQFSSEHQPRWNGSADSAEPLPTPRGDARRQAAEMITGKSSYTRLEELTYLQRLAEDPTQPDTVRQQVRTDLAQIDTGGPVHPAYERARALVEATMADHGDELERLAKEALARVRVNGAKPKKSPTRPRPEAASAEAAKRWPVRAFVTIWDELSGWTQHFDPVELANAVTEEQAELFLAVVEDTVHFADQLRAARHRTATGSNHPIEDANPAECWSQLRAI